MSETLEESDLPEETHALLTLYGLEFARGPEGQRILRFVDPNHVRHWGKLSERVGLPFYEVRTLDEISEAIENAAEDLRSAVIRVCSDIKQEQAVIADLRAKKAIIEEVHSIEASQLFAQLCVRMKVHEETIEEADALRRDIRQAI